MKWLVIGVIQISRPGKSVDLWSLHGLCCILLFKSSHEKYFLSLLVSLDQGTAAALLLNPQLNGVSRMCILPSLALNGYLIPHEALIFNTVKQPFKTQTLS